MKRFFSNLALYAFHLFFARPIVRFLVGARYRGRHRLPKGPCLVVANHNSHLDAAVLMTLFPLKRLPRVHPVAAADYFGSSVIRRTFAMLLMNGIPIQRKPPKGVDPLTPAVETLESGDSLILFPEGSRGEAGVMARFRPGIGRLVKQMPGLLIVPVYLSGPERIWPRGQVVPVPLNIDAIVGRPRSYSPELDARTIAEKVQQEVLALAPPPPPAPSRPSPPIRIAFCGVDQEHRAELVRRTAQRLGRAERTLGITDPPVLVDDAGIRETTTPIPYAPARAWLGLLAWLFRTSGRYKGHRFVRMVERAQVDEALSGGEATRFVVTDGSALVDLMAWAEADFYQNRFDENEVNHLLQYLAGQKNIRVASWWKFIRKAPEIWLINVFALARPPVPDVLVNLRMPGPDQMQRLRARGEELLPHQNETFLDKLHEGYRSVGSVLKKRRKVELLEFDVGRTDPETILTEVEAVARRLIEDNVANRTALEKTPTPAQGMNG